MRYRHIVWWGQGWLLGFGFAMSLIQLYYISLVTLLLALPLSVWLVLTAPNGERAS